MAKSKYDQFWRTKVNQIHTGVRRTMATSNETIISCQEILSHGERQSWYGTIMMSQGKIVFGGNMAHMKSLGNIIAPSTTTYEGYVFRLSMNDSCQLTINLVEIPEKSEKIINNTDFDKQVQIPISCEELHRLVWDLPQHDYRVDWKCLPSNGIYFLFEVGENAHGGDRIVYIGTHRKDDRIKGRLQNHYNGNRRSSTFRNHLGKALDNKLGRIASKDEVSSYIQRHIKFAVMPLDGSKNKREDFEGSAIKLINLCPVHKSSEYWLGHYSRESGINKSGLWNVQGVEIQKPHQEEHKTSILILIPCSGKKSLSGSDIIPNVSRNTVFDYLSFEKREDLQRARGFVEPIANFDRNMNQRSSLGLYNGFMYQINGFKTAILKSEKQKKCKVGIISGGYGLLLPSDRIFKYNCSMNKSYKLWMDFDLPNIISDFAKNINANLVIAFLGSKTAYANILRKVEWENTNICGASIYCPIPDHRGGFQQRVPKFLGKAVTAFLNSGCDLQSLANFTTEKMSITNEALYPL